MNLRFTLLLGSLLSFATATAQDGLAYRNTITLSVLDIRGSVVETLHKGTFPSSLQCFTLQRNREAAEVYFIRLSSQYQSTIQ